MEAWKALARRARKNDGIVTTADAIACGITRRTFYRQAQSHGWTRIHPDVWAAPGYPDTYDRKLSAAVAWLGDGFAFTGFTVLWLLGVVERPPPVVDVLRAEARQGPAHIAFHTGGADDEPVRRVNGRPATTAERAFGDIAARITVVQLARLVARACALRCTTLARMLAYRAAKGRCPGSATMHGALTALQSDLAHSRDEERARRLLRAAGLTFHAGPLAVLRGTRIIAEIDIAFSAIRYGVEIDGPHHLLPEIARKDKARDGELGRLGWTIDRFTIEEIAARPEAFVAHVRSRVAQLSQAGGTERGVCQ